MYKKVALPSPSNHTKVKQSANTDGTTVVMKDVSHGSFAMSNSPLACIYTAWQLYLSFLRVCTTVGSGCCDVWLFERSSPRGQRYFACFRAI